MEFYEVIERRHTVRQFLGRKPALEQNVADLDRQIHFGRWR